MIRTLQLIVFPFSTWERIVAAGRNVWLQLMISVLPLMAVAAVAEGSALAAWGKRAGEFGRVVRFTQSQAQWYELVQIGIHIAAIFLAALVLAAVAKSFDFQVPFSACVLTFGYGFGGIFVSWIINSAPGLESWISWAIGIALSIPILYHGVAIVLKPPQTKGFGLFLIGLLVFACLSGLAHAFVLGFAKTQL